MSVKGTLRLTRRASRNDFNVLTRVTESTTRSATMTERRIAIDTRGFAGEKNFKKRYTAYVCQKLSASPHACKNK
jgi:hypothetical protein